MTLISCEGNIKSERQIKQNISQAYRNTKSIEKDTDRDRFMSADEAKEYGIIDQVLNEESKLT